MSMWLRDAQTTGEMCFVGVPLMEFLKEMSIGLPRPGKEMALLSAGVSSNLLGPMEHKGEGRANDFFLSWMPSSPVLGHQSFSSGPSDPGTETIGSPGSQAPLVLGLNCSTCFPGSLGFRRQIITI